MCGKKSLFIVVLLVFVLGFTGVTMANEPVIGDAASYVPPVWKDWPAYDYDIAAWLRTTGIMTGYPDGEFKPWEPVTEYQVAVVAQRAGIRNDVGEYDFFGVPAKMGWVETYFLPGTVLSAGPDEICTRYRFAKMLFRYGLRKPGPTNEIIPSPNPVDSRVKILNELFYEHRWNGRLTPLVGHEETLIRQSDETGVPLWLCLAQGWKESCWGTNGSSIWGIKGGGGFKSYDSIDAAIKDYFKLIRYGPGNTGRYWKYLQAGDIDGLVELYAPSYENNHSSYMQTLWIVKGWVDKKGL